jgi:hypothetical protein
VAGSPTGSPDRRRPAASHSSRRRRSRSPEPFGTTLRLCEHPVLSGVAQLELGHVDVARVGDSLAGNADPLELCARLEKRSRIERSRHEHARSRKRHEATLRVDHKKRDTHIPGHICLRSGNERDVVAWGTPELFQRHAPSGVTDLGRISARPAAADEEQARQHGQCRSWAHTRPSVARVVLASVRPGAVTQHLTEPSG